MGIDITHIIKAFLLPPSGLILMLIASIVLLKRHAKAARLALIVLTSLFFILSLPVFSGLLMRSLEIYPALNSKQISNADAQAIVILSGGREKDAEEYGGDTVSSITLDRLRYGAYLYRLTKLPILVTGGIVRNADISEAQLMVDSLQQDFAIASHWQEKQSRNTAENAIFTGRMLKKDNITKIFLVTSAWHMRRSMDIFKQQGFQVTAAPTHFAGLKKGPFMFADFIPTATAFQNSTYALHEMIGYMWYQIRY